MRPLNRLRIDAGLCQDCGIPRDDAGTQTRCKECSLKKNYRRRVVRQRKAYNGTCSKCGTSIREGVLRCDNCITEGSKQAREKRFRRREQGICELCGIEVNSERKAGRSQIICDVCIIKRMALLNFSDSSRWARLLEKLEDQRYKCAYTGETLIIGVNASLDHIVPVSRYPRGVADMSNVEWVTSNINIMKRDLTKEEFLRKIQEIYRYAVEGVAG